MIFGRSLGNIQVDAADPADERWNPAAVLRSWISVRNEATEAAEAAEVDAGAEEVAEEQEQPEEEQETGAEAEPEQGLQLAAPDAAVASAGPSGVVEGTKLSEEEIVKIVEAKRKKTTLRTIWSTWQDVVNEAHREVSVEEREHLEALRVLGILAEGFFVVATNLAAKSRGPLGDLEELQSEHKIRYRAFVVPMRRRHAEEEGRLKDLQKILKQIDPEKLQQKSLEKAKGNKAGDKGGNAAMAEIISKAQTTVQKLLKFSEDFQKNEITPNFLMEEAEATVRKILMSRRLLMGVKLATAKTKKDAPVFSPSETCLPSLLRRLELESYLYPTWICEQLKRRLARLRGEAVNFQGAPILWGPRRRWDSRARTFSIEEAVKLCKDMNVAAPMPVTQKTPEDLVDTVEDSQDTVEATEAETPDAANLAQGNAETARRVEAEEQPGETGQPEDAEPEDQPEDQTEAEPSEALEASKDTKVAWELEDEATVEEENSARPFTLGEEDDMQEQNATVGQEVDEESEEAIEQPELKEGDEQINGKVSSPGAQPLEPSEQRMEDAAHEETKDAEKAEQEEAALNSALEEEGAEAEDNHEGHQDAIEESKEEQGEQDAPECAKEETTEPEDIDSAGQGELAESPPDEKDSKEEIAEEDALEAPEIADEHFGSPDMTSQPEQKETPAADAEGENASLCIGEARGETPEDQPVSQADAQAELEERQRKKAAKFEKKRQQKKETQEDLAVEEEPDPGLLAQWCEDEKELRDKAVKLCMQLCKSLAELMNSNSNTNKQGQKEEKAGQKAPPSRRFLQQLKEKVDSKVAEWQEFCNCPASDVFIKNQALWTQKRRKRFGELMDCQDDLEWAKPNSKADEKISLLQRGITSPERGAWALHYGAEIIMMEAVGDDSVKALMDQVATMGLTKRTTEGLDMALLRELVSYQGSNPMSDMEGVVASMREGSLNSFLIFELSALVTDFPVTALKGALMGAPYKHKVKEGAYFGMSFLVSQLKNDKTYAKYRSYHVSNNTIRMTSLTSHLLLSLSDRSPTSSALDVIYNIEKVFPGIEKMKADEETAILSWSSEAVMKKDSVTNASKAAKEAQQRAKNSKRFPMLVPKELYKTLVDVTGHEGFIPFEGISAKDFLEAIMQCATELFNGKTESFLELKKLLSNMKIVGVDSDEVQTDVAKQLQSLIFMGEKVTEMSGEEILLQPDGTEDVEELQQMLVENASALSAVFSKMDGDQIKSLGFPDQVTTKLIENYKRKMPVTAAEVLSISFELGTLGMKPKTDAQRVQELVDVLGGLTVEGIIKKKFASLTKKVSTLDEFKTVLKAGDVYGIMDKTDKATKVTEILAEAKLDRSFFDAALLCVACRELDYKDEAMKLVAKSDPGFIGELIEVAAGTTMTKDLDEFKDLFKKEIKDIWLAGMLLQIAPVEKGNDKYSQGR
ncbi:unnamed protein product [Cladocopium goreaui]|uniref:Cyclin-related protein, putative n=1 Tax=Cladocopium goreaui TaxID=2562237 RepID=A0A9P1BU49_9DINO|nr:unnamed protein product [Cladocopium goreaui]